MPEGDLGRRFLIAVGSSEYESSDFRTLTRVPHDIDQVVEFFTSPVQGYRRVLAEDIPLNAQAGKIKSAITNWFSLAERRASDQVIFFLAGHGDTDGKQNRHYLFTSNSNLNNLSDTAIRTEELFNWFFEGHNERPQNLLVILDTCYSGKGSGQAATLAAASKGTSFDDAEDGMCVIASARPNDEAGDGHFVDALLAVTKDTALGDRSQKYVHPDDLVEKINDWFKDKELAQRAETDKVAARRMPRFIINSNYRSGLAGLVLSDEAHWDPKARGAEHITEVGWYFTGRHAALQQLVEFLVAKKSDRRARVVTGGPGSGKSAVLARLVTCAHATTRKQMEASGALDGAPEDTLAPPGSIDVPIHARGQSIEQVASAIADACGFSDSDPTAVLKALATERPKPLAVVVDALDEAQKPEELDEKFLRPLAELPTVRLIVGSRMPREDTPPLAERAEILNLDKPEYFDEGDIIEYVRRRLRRIDPPSPYLNVPEDTVLQIAHAVAHKAQKSFLFARFVTRRLADAKQAIDTKRAGWDEQLPSDLSEAFEQDLKRFPDAQRRRFQDLLVPLAYSKGRGLPHDIWRRLASSIARSEFTDHDIGELKKIAGYYIIEDVEQERSVYRLFHEEFAAYLRNETRDLDIDGTIANALIKIAAQGKRRPQWDHVNQPYILTYLAGHAANVNGLLDKLVVDPNYLIHADPSNLMAALEIQTPKPPASDRAQEFKDVYLLGQHNLRRTQKPEERAAYLELTAHEQQASRATNAFRTLSHRNLWQPLWASTKPKAVHITLEGHRGDVHAVALGERKDGTRVIVSGSQDETVRVWDLESGEPLGQPLKGHGEPVYAVAVGERKGGRRIIVSGSGDKTVRVWDLESGEPLGQPLEGHSDRVFAVAVGELKDRRRIIVSGSRDKTVRVWDLESGEPLGQPLEGHSNLVSAVALGERKDGKRIIVSGSGDKTVRVWDLESGEALGQPLKGHRGDVHAVALGERKDGTRVIVSGSQDETVRVWDLESGEPLGQPLKGHGEPVYAVAVGERKGGRRIIVSGSADNTVRVWDLESGEPLGQPLEGHSDWVTAVAVGERKDGKRIIISGSRDKTVRVWDLESGEPLGQPLEGHSNLVSAVTLGERKDGKRIIVSGSGDKTVRVWDLESGEPLGQPLTGHSDTVNAVALGERKDRRRIIVSGSGDKTVRVWDLESGEPLGQPLEGHSDRVFAVAVGELKDRRRIIVSGSWDKTVRVWDLESGEPLGQPLEGHSDLVFDVTLGERKDGRRIIVSGSVDKTVRVWDLESGEALGRPLEGHSRGVTAVALGERKDGRRIIVSGSQDETVRVWDLESGEPLGQPLKGHSDAVYDLAVGERKDGRRIIVSGSWDNTVRVWDLESGAALSMIADAAIRIALHGGTLVLGKSDGLVAISI